jgi:chromosome partitioning protein
MGLLQRLGLPDQRSPEQAVEQPPGAPGALRSEPAGHEPPSVAEELLEEWEPLALEPKPPVAEAEAAEPKPEGAEPKPQAVEAKPQAVEPEPRRVEVEPEPRPLEPAAKATELAAAPPHVKPSPPVAIRHGYPPASVSPGQRPAEPEPERSVKRAKVIAFANQKGGVAKTTTTLNLAVAFAETGHRVLCVDMDPQGNLTMSQGVDPDALDRSMYDVLVHHMAIKDVIREREVDIACASIDLAGAEIAMSTQIGRERSLEKALRAVIEDYDFVCIDTPPSLGLLTINALTAADKVIVPVQCEYLSMRGLVQLQNTLSMIRQELNPEVEIEGILPTLVDSRTVHAKEAIEILEENFGDRVFATRIRKTIRFAEAPVKGTSVLKYDPDGVAAQSYRDLAKEVLANGKR